MQQGIFLPESTFSADSYGIYTPLCAIACIYICVHVKDPVIHVRVQWIIETLKHPAKMVTVYATVDLVIDTRCNLGCKYVH